MTESCRRRCLTWVTSLPLRESVGGVLFKEDAEEFSGKGPSCFLSFLNVSEAE